jgi:hypothetical protein
MRRIGHLTILAADHILGNGVQGYYDLTADRCQLESNPDDAHAALSTRCSCA